MLPLLLLLFQVKGTHADDFTLFGIENDGYLSEFSVIHNGRLRDHAVLILLEDLSKDECINECVENLQCVGVSYSAIAKLCELNDIDFDIKEAVKDGTGWVNYATPGIADGGWTKWKNEAGCTRTCGGGTLTYHRSCTNPIPRYGGAECEGPLVKHVPCNTRHCPVAGGWGNWKSVTRCSHRCGGGTIKYHRTCNNPKPRYGGEKCTGERKKTEQCNTHKCNK